MRNFQFFHFSHYLLNNIYSVGLSHDFYIFFCTVLSFVGRGIFGKNQALSWGVIGFLQMRDNEKTKAAFFTYAWDLGTPEKLGKKNDTFFF